MRHLRLSDLIVRGLAPLVGAVIMLLGVGATPAAAVPAFAVQTGQPCQACHVGGFGPQLTPFGRNFKLHGYTPRTNTFNVPLSAMAVASFVNTAKDQPPTHGFAANNNVALDQISLFIAGGLGSHLGAFIQTTYDGVARAFSWDNLDVRATTTFQVKDADVVVGASLNNNPTVQDAWNTTPAWGYAYTGSALAPSPSASPLFSGALAQTSLGVTAYAWINSEFFLEGGAYGSPGATTLVHLGADPTAPGSIKGLAPYGRIAFQHDVGGGTLEVGAFGMQASIYPGLDRTLDLTDDFTDLGLDASYIKTLANGDVVTVNGRYTHERQNLKYTCATAALDEGADGVACPKGNDLNDIRVDASYYWRNQIGGTVQVFNTSGSSNPYAYGYLNGFRTNKPDSTGVTLQLDGTPFGGATDGPLGHRFNIRAGIQYTFYTQFNGAGSNWDNAGAKASDNNTLRVFTWIAY
jgi:hypothetical protein